MIRLASAAIAASLLLAACSTASTPDASAAPAVPKDFCHAMQAAAEAAAPAATSLDDLFAQIDTMAAGSSDGDIAALNAAGTASVEASTAYVATLDTAKGLAPAEVTEDFTTLASYWNLYALGMAQIAESVTSYGKLVDQTQALASSEEATSLIAEQPAAQSHINDVYLQQCS